MVATESLEADLRDRGFNNIVRWTRGIDTDLFQPQEKGLSDLTRPIYLYVGRVAVEKNIECFLNLDLPGSKVIVGDGPQRRELERKYQNAHFLGMKSGKDLAYHYASADVFIFPSKTDTFGLVLLEALASGVPVAAFPVTGPLDVIGDEPVGKLDNDLRQAALDALKIDPIKCREYSLEFSWEKSARQFKENLAAIETSKYNNNQTG